MIAEELIRKFKIDPNSLTDQELDEIYLLLKNNRQLAKDIQGNWIFDDYLSRAICIDRQMFPTQVLIRISEFEADQSNLLTMAQIVAAAKNAKLTQSGRYTTRKVSERKKSPISKRRDATTSARRKAHKKSGIGNYLIAIAALMLLGFGFFYLQTSQKQSIKNENLTPAVATNNVKLVGPKIITASNSNILLKDKKISTNLTQIPLEVGSSVQVDKGGSLIFEFEDKTLVTLQENSLVKILNTTPKELFLEYGQMKCDVAKQVNPFLITTNNSNVKVLGTILNVSLKPNELYPSNDSTELIVEKGKVEIENKISKEKVLVSQGEYAVVNKSEKLVSRSIPAKKLSYNFSEKAPTGFEVSDFKNAKAENGILKVSKEGSVIIKLKNAEWKFPLKVSLNIMFEEHLESKMITTSMVWDDVSYGIWPVGVEAYLKTKEWISMTTYITEDGYFYTDYASKVKGPDSSVFTGRFYYLEKGPKAEELEIFLGDIASYESLEVSEIKTSELHDISEGKAIFENMPRKNEVGFILIEKFPRFIDNKLEYQKFMIRTGPRPFLYR